jgi:hypothetical protein
LAARVERVSGWLPAGITFGAARDANLAEGAGAAPLAAAMKLHVHLASKTVVW